MAKFLILFLLSINILISKELSFIISYRLVVKNNMVINEKFNVSKAMEQSRFIKTKKIIKLNCKNQKSIKKCILAHQDILTQKLFKTGILINEKQNKQMLSINAKTVLVFPPTNIVADIKENFVTIYLVGE